MSRKNIVISVLTAILLFWIVNAVFTATRTKFLDLARPALKFSSNTINKVKSLILPETELSRENRILKDSLEIMKSRLVRLEELELENGRLRGLLEFKKNTPYKTVSARVIGRDPSNWTNIIYIDKGKDDGIKKYMAVTTAKGLAGRVVEAGESSAKVMCITDPDSRIGVLIQDTRHDGLLCGALNSRCRMEYIPLEADVWPGDLIVSSGSGGTVPEGLLVGVVEDVFVDKNGLYQSAVIKPAVDLSKLEEVLCIE